MSLTGDVKSTPKKQKHESELMFIDSPAEKDQDLYERLINTSPPRRLFMPQQNHSSEYYSDDLYLSSIIPEQDESQMVPQQQQLEKKPDDELIKQQQMIRKVSTPMKSNRGCKCQKSHCLKKYCDCFKVGEVCSKDCSCIGCKNDSVTQTHQKQVKMIELTRSGKGGKETKCNCQRSHCLKNYCECHSAGKGCTTACNCLQCQNKFQSTIKNKKKRQFIQVSDWTELKEKKQNILFN